MANTNTVERAFIWGQENDPGFRFNRQFPGAQFGGSIQQIKGLINKQKRITGLRMALGVGFNEFTFKMSGSAKMLLGVLILSAAATETISVLVNGETVIDNCPATCLSQIGKTREEEYFLFPRPLSGSDTIKVIYNATAGVVNWMNFYFL